MSKEKNAQIKATLLATKERRKTQKCFVFSTKIDYRKLNKLQKEQLQMLFVEAKWVYNDIINHLESDKLSSWDGKKKAVMVKQKDGSFVEKPLLYFKSALMQGMKSKVGDSLNSLKEKKKKGYKVGRLKFKSSCNSIPLKQFGNTHRIKSLSKIGITGITGNFHVNGLDQFEVFFVSVRKRERCTTPEINAYHLITALNDRQFIFEDVNSPMDVISIRLLKQLGVGYFCIWVVCKLLQSMHSKVSRDSSDANLAQRLDPMRVTKLL